MKNIWRGPLLMTVGLTALFAGNLSAQTAIVLNPDGAAISSQVTTVQSDGSGNTVVFTQGVAGANAGGNGVAAQGGVVGGVVGFGGPVAPRDQTAAPVTGTSRIRGRVTDSVSGRPLRRATVRITSAGIRESRSTTTDQDGLYEFTQLPAAQYNVSANKTGYVQLGYRQTRPNGPPRPITLGEREIADHIDVALIPGGVITGRVVDEYGEPVSDVFVSAQRQQYSNGARRPVSTGAPSSANDIGEFRLYGLAPGDYYVLANPRNQTNPFETSTDRTGYGQTYYPSTADISAAQRVTVHAGDVVANIVVALAPTRTVRISGTVLDGQGQPARGGNVMVTSRNGPGFPGANGMVRPDGSFTVSGVAPGEYTLRAILPTQTGTASQPNFSTANVIVSGADLTNVILEPQLPVAIAGRLTGDAAALARINPATARISVVSFGGPTYFTGPPPPPPTLKSDLSFELLAYPGTVAVRPLSLQGLIIRSVRLNGRDVTRGFDVQAGVRLDDLEVEVTASTAKLDITVANARGEAVAEQDVIVFPEDESKWGAQMPGHGTTGRTDETGRFQTPPLLAGSYYVIAPDGLEPGDSNDPDILESLRTRAQRVTVAESETASVQVRR